MKKYVSTPFYMYLTNAYMAKNISIEFHSVA